MSRMHNSVGLRSNKFIADSYNFVPNLMNKWLSCIELVGIYWYSTCFNICSGCRVGSCIPDSFWSGLIASHRPSDRCMIMQLQSSAFMIAIYHRMTLFCGFHRSIVAISHALVDSSSDLFNLGRTFAWCQICSFLLNIDQMFRFLSQKYITCSGKMRSARYQCLHRNCTRNNSQVPDFLYVLVFQYLFFAFVAL